MLDYVAQASPSTHVYVSTLLPLSGDDTSAVNAAIRGVVADAVSRGQNVSLVEMPSVTLSDLFDGIHRVISSHAIRCSDARTTARRTWTRTGGSPI